MNIYKILLVDDVVENIQTLAGIYEQLHPEYRLYQATNGKSAVEIVKTMKIDLIVSDWDMPGMSGIDLVKEIKSDPKTNHIPIIIVTGVMLSTADLRIALEAGAHDYLRKPVEPVELCARTHSAISLMKMHQREMDAKNLELVEKTMMLSRNNQFNSELYKKLRDIEENIDHNISVGEAIHGIINYIDLQSRENNWRHFEVAFHNIHREFSRNLVARFSSITPGELRHCQLIRLGLSTKDMASILFQSPDSIKVTRSRIRKKLQMDNDRNLETFLTLI